MIGQFANVLREQIRKDVNNYIDDLARGQCRTIDEYQKHCGMIQGLTLAEQYV